MTTIPPEYLNQIVTGDVREFAQRIPDESVDFIFTDPIYDRIDDYRWLAETAERVLKQTGDLIVYLANYHENKVSDAIGRYLTFRWRLTEKKIGSGALMFQYRLFGQTVPLLWFTKGDARNDERISRTDFMWATPNGTAVNHEWAKNELRAMYWLSHFGLDDDIVLEPFCGGGAIVSGCKMLGRDYIAFEIDPDVAERARERVRNTQPPLFVLQPEQSVMEFEA